MITSKHGSWDAKFRAWRQHGMSVPDTVRHKAKTIVFERYPEIGFNYRLSDVQAAMGREQLKRLDMLVQHRRSLAAIYTSSLSDVEGLAVPLEEDWARSNWQSYCVRLTGGQSQRRVMQYLLEHGIATRRGIMCAHREAAYGKNTCRSAGTLQESERAQDECILLPLFHQLTPAEQETVVAKLREAARMK